MQEVIQNDFSINHNNFIKQQDNQLFRLVRKITGQQNKHNSYVAFIDCGKGSIDQDKIDRLIRGGVIINNKRYVFSERSASMTRNGIFSMVDESIFDELNKRITMDITVEKTVLSKYYAYRGLFFSSCHCLDTWRPKIIVVPDCSIVIPQQTIKYLDEKRHIQQDVLDITITPFDGCGIHHPALTKEMTEMLGSKTPVTSAMIRAPWIKGLTHEVNYEEFYEQRGVEFIKDVWGMWHSIHDKMMILTESMFKGKKFFSSWDAYWDKFDKYEHCIGIAKWNFSFAEEPIYTRANYQILQDLNMPYETFRDLADESIEWAEKILDGDPMFTNCFLGLTADKCTPISAYAKAILKNPEMMKEESVRNYFIQTTMKYIDEMKCGKLWLKSCFKFLVPDLIMLMEHVAELPLKGCLAENEFYARSFDGIANGEHLIERNPHICRSEHAVLTGSGNELAEYYCGHLANTCMVNSKSLIAQRLNGADFDGDLILLLKNDIMMQGVDKNAPIVIDIDDKITAISEPDTVENRIALTMRTLKSFIGEYSNVASAYHNKCPRTREQKELYESFIDIASIVVGKSIDYAKTGIIYFMPKHISRFGRPLPYFMKYRSAYYKKQKLSMAQSNLNRLCRDIEEWHKTIKWKRTYKDFNYGIMMNKDIKPDENIFKEIEKIYLEYCAEIKDLAQEQMRIRLYRDPEIKKIMTKYDAQNFVFNWEVYYEKYRALCREACQDENMLANIVVQLCYETHKNKNKRFMWVVAENGILNNIEQAQNILLPKRDPFGAYEYLGRRYSMVLTNTEEIEVEDFWEDIDFD